MKQNKISLEFSLNSTPRVKEICEPLTKYMDIKFFAYLKLFNDCTYLLLLNGYNDFLIKHLETIKEQDTHFKNEFRNSVINEPSFFIWPIEYKKLLPATSLHKEFNIWHGCSINYRSSNYVEHFAFAFDLNADDKSQFYKQNFQLLSKFCDYFKVQAADLINHKDKSKLSSYKNKFDISYIKDADVNRQKFFDIINNKQPSKLISKSGKLVSLTKREADCISILMQNRSTKEIGKMLNLSSRTVENYIAKVKQKLEINYKSQLIDIFSNNHK